MTWLRDTLNNKGARAKCLKWAYFALATSLHVLAKVTIGVILLILRTFGKIPDAKQLLYSVVR